MYKSRTNEKSMELLAEIPISAPNKPLGLRISSAGDTYSFYVSEDFKSWKTLQEKVDAKFLSTKAAGSFIGCLYGMYATSSGETSTNSASFKYLKYGGNDPMFK